MNGNALARPKEGAERFAKKINNRYSRCVPVVAAEDECLAEYSTPLLSGLMTVMVPPCVRSATAKNNAMAIAAGLIWRAIFVFIGIRFYPFLRKNFPSVAKFSKSEFLSRISWGQDTIRNKRKPSSSIVLDAP
jgi:hypothetical protein